MVDELFKEHYDQLLALINKIRVGIYITDREGKTVLVNDESCKKGGLTREQVQGKYMKDLEREGFIKESITLKTLRSNKPEVMIQELGDGGRVFATAEPLFKNEKISYVITTERDITEVYVLKELLKESQKNYRKVEEEIEYLRGKEYGEHGTIIAIDPSSIEIVEKAMRVANLNTTVLLSGDSGTGKEVFASMMHNNSMRSDKPFIKLNCATIPENLAESELFGYEGGAFTGAERKGKMGYFELAHGGTLFLDEIGEFPLALQPKLLRAIQENEIVRLGGERPIKIDIRLIVATNRNLENDIEEGRFREDLYYRLNVMPIKIPPLRERKKDIEPMVLFFLGKYNTKYRGEKVFTKEALEVLSDYWWPGNVRELQNIVERVVISYDENIIDGEKVKEILFPSGGKAIATKKIAEEWRLQDHIENCEKEVIYGMLKASKNATEAAKKLGISKSTMSRKLKRYEIV